MVEMQLNTGEMLHIREALPKDARAILKYLDIISGESDNLTFGIGEFTMTVDQEAEFLKNILQSSNNIYILGIVQQTIVATANISSSSRPRLKHRGELAISVRRDYWRKGIGRAIMNYLIAWAPSAGLRKIDLSVRDDNLGAILLYQQLGFIEEGRRSRQMRINGEYITTIEMGLNIDP